MIGQPRVINRFDSETEWEALGGEESACEDMVEIGDSRMEMDDAASSHSLQVKS